MKVFLSALTLVLSTHCYSSNPGNGTVNFKVTPEAVPLVKTIGSKPSSLLVVGNSYTYYNCGINGYLSNFLIGDALASGKAKDETSARKLFKTRIAAIGRGNLSQYPIAEYLDNASMASHESLPQIEDKYLRAEQKKRETYALVLMQGSNRPFSDQARDAYYIPQHVKAIRAQGGEPALIMTWTQKNKTAPAMSDVRDATTQIANDNGMMVIPVGLAFAESEKTYPDIPLIRSDKTHPTAAGSFLYAATLYASVYERNPVTAQKAFWKTLCDHPLSEDVREKLSLIAHKTVQTFYSRK